MQTKNGSIELASLFTVEGLAAEFPKFLSVNTVRWQLRHRETNGLDAACIRVGKKLLISKPRYEQWLASQAGAKRCSK